MFFSCRFCGVKIKVHTDQDEEGMCDLCFDAYVEGGLKGLEAKMPSRSEPCAMPSEIRELLGHPVPGVNSPK